MYNLSINYYYRPRCIEEHLYTHIYIWQDSRSLKISLEIVAIWICLI